MRLAQVASSALILCAAALAVSALMAQPSTEAQLRKKECKDWPGDAQKQKKVADAFTKALNDSAMNNDEGTKLRADLLEPAQAKTTMQRILDKMYPNENIVFPRKAEVRFYEPEEPVDTPPTKTMVPKYPSEHCIHILYLPEVVTAQRKADKASFAKNLMCCYPPW
jgi:hypothetical protein